MIDELIKHTKEYQELSYLAEAAQKEVLELRDRITELEKELGGDHYVPQEYPKMLPNGKIVNSAEEEHPEPEDDSGAYHGI